MEEFKFKFIMPPTTRGTLKCTIHLSGKMGFSKAAIEEMGITQDKSIQIARNEANKNDENLYLFISEMQRTDAFKIIKAGNYYYLNTKGLFDEMDIDYINKKVIYDIHPMEIKGAKLYKLTRRELGRKRKQK